MKRTLPASMNHNDPQLSDTPTALDASDPDVPVRISSKYRRLTPEGILFGAYRGIEIPSVRDSQRSLETARPTRRSSSTRSPVKVRDGQVANRPFYVAIGVLLAGERGSSDCGLAPAVRVRRFSLAALTALPNRGVKDAFFVVCDGLKGLPEVVGNMWPPAIVQTCIIHLLRNTVRLISRTNWHEIKRDVKPIHTTVNATAERSAFDELTEKLGATLRGQ